MFRLIKSRFIKEKIIIHLDDKAKLKIFKYNKKLQHIAKIDLINYMFYANKYIMFDGKVKGKEYNIFKDELLYEGEFLNDKRNGIGKEYSNGRIVYEGEFLNGKRSGKGKEYSHGKIVYDGEYLNGEKHGKGKEYKYWTGTLIFEGEYLNGKKNGKAKEFVNDNLIFEGEYFNDVKNGKAKEYYKNNLIFEGEYLNGLRWNGKGKEYLDFEFLSFLKK